MAFSSYDDIIYSLGHDLGQSKYISKASITSVQGFMYSLWKATGTPNSGIDPTPALQGQVPTNDTEGAIRFASPTNGRSLHALSFGATSASAGNLYLYDRIWHCGGFSANTTSTQTITGVQGPTRYADGYFNEIALEVTTALGTTSRTVNVLYTNIDGVSGRTASVTLPASCPVNRVYTLNLQSGDRGVKSIQAVNLLGGTMGAGVFNLFMFNGGLFIPVAYVANYYTERDLVLQMANLPKIYDDACLALMVFAAATSTGTIMGRLVVAEG